MRSKEGNNHMRKYLPLALAGLIVAAAGPAIALDDWVGGNRLNVPADQWKSASEIASKLSAEGYKVIEIESDDGAYEVEMTDKNGVRVDTHVHPATGELLTGYDD
jgi:hypothetical protein